MGKARQLGCPKIVLDHVRVYIYIYIYMFVRTTMLKRAVGEFNNRFPARRRSIKGDWPGRKEVILVS